MDWWYFFAARPFKLARILISYLRSSHSSHRSLIPLQLVLVRKAGITTYSKWGPMVLYTFYKFLYLQYRAVMSVKITFGLCVKFRSICSLSPSNYLIFGRTAMKCNELKSGHQSIQVSIQINGLRCLQLHISKWRGRASTHWSSCLVSKQLDSSGMLFLSIGLPNHLSLGVDLSILSSVQRCGYVPAYIICLSSFLRFVNNLHRNS